jgi:hypothetical protein
MQTHTYILPRTEGLTLKLIALVRLESPDSEETALENFKEAISNWLGKTPEGQDQWENSSHDFNIGDLSFCNLEDIKPFLTEKNIYNLYIETHSTESEMHYDTIFEPTKTEEAETLTA